VSAEQELLEGWLARIRYKPDTRFMVLPPGVGDIVSRSHLAIGIKRQMADSRAGIDTLEEFTDTDRFVTIRAVWYVPPMMLEQDFTVFTRWVRDQLRQLETHELDEWFTADGKLPYDPHVGKGEW
jgi:hypothetical protein